MIFENERLELLSIKFKRNGDFATLYRICDHLTPLMSAIIIRSKYTATVPFPDLMAHLYAQVPKWVEKWRPAGGKFYTYVSTSIKNGSLSLVVREQTLRQRMHSVGEVPLEALGGYYNPHESYGLSEDLARQLEEIHVRWHEEPIREAIRVIVFELFRHRGETRIKRIDLPTFDLRKALLRTLVIGYDLTSDEARFLIDWTRGAVRSALLERFKSPLSEADIIRLQDKFSFMPDLIAEVGLERTKRLMLIFAGTSIRFPTQAQVKRNRATCKVMSDLAEDPLADVGEFDHDQMLQAVSNLSSGITEDVPLFTEDETESLMGASL